MGCRPRQGRPSGASSTGFGWPPASTAPVSAAHRERWRGRRARASLMHYTAGADAGRPAVLLVPSLINRSYIWDLRHGDSFVERLLGAGYDVLCLDWAYPTPATRTTPCRPMSTTTWWPRSPRCVGGARRRRSSSATASAASSRCCGRHRPEEQPRALITMAAPTDWDDVGPLSWLTRQAPHRARGRAR